MAERREEVQLAGGARGPRHVRVDGRWRSHPGAVLVAPHDVRRLWVLSCIVIPPQYGVATADHETGMCANEVDTETTGLEFGPNPEGVVTMGLFQVDAGEATSVGDPTADLYDPVVCTRVFARLQERRLATLVSEGGPREPDLWAYLGLAHNEGLPAAVKTIRRWGMDYREYARRNAESAARRAVAATTPEERAAASKETDRVRRITKYMADMISGGDRWAET